MKRSEIKRRPVADTLNRTPRSTLSITAAAFT